MSFRGEWLPLRVLVGVRGGVVVAPPRFSERCFGGIAEDNYMPLARLKLGRKIGVNHASGLTSSATRQNLEPRDRMLQRERICDRRVCKRELRELAAAGAEFTD